MPLRFVTPEEAAAAGHRLRLLHDAALEEASAAQACPVTDARPTREEIENAVPARPVT